MSADSRNRYPEQPNRMGSSGYADKAGSARNDSYAALLGYGSRASVAQQAPQPPRGFQPKESVPPHASTPVFGAKDHVVAALLAIFLGALGIHKFYLGYNTAAFITLAVTVLGSIFTFGLAASVMGVIALVEGIIYLTKSQTEFEQIYVVGSKEWF